MNKYCGMYQNNVVGINIRKENYNRQQAKPTLETTFCFLVSHFLCKQIYIHVALIDLEKQMTISVRKEAKFSTVKHVLNTVLTHLKSSGFN